MTLFRKIPTYKRSEHLDSMEVSAFFNLRVHVLGVHVDTIVIYS